MKTIFELLKMVIYAMFDCKSAVGMQNQGVIVPFRNLSDYMDVSSGKLYESYWPISEIIYLDK